MNNSKVAEVGARKLLDKGSIALRLQGRTKEEIIDELLAVAERSGKIKDLAAAREAVLEREGRMSTGMHSGVALPHGKTDAVEDLVAVLGVSEHGVDFQALDGLECRIFALTLSPASQIGPPLRFLAEASLLLENANNRSAILAAETEEDILKVFSARPASSR